MTVQQDISARPAIDPQLGEAAALAASGMGEAVLKDSEQAVKEIEAGATHWKSWAQGAYQANVKAWRALMGCRSASAVAAVHSRLMADHIELMMGNGRLMTAAMVQASGGHDAK